MRRTTTHDSRRPDGLLGRVIVDARGREVRTGLDGEATVLATARLDVDVEYVPFRTVTTIDADPPHPGLAALVGVPASTGFRQAVDDALPGERGSRSLRSQLLDDLPTALLVSGYAIGAGGVTVPRKVPRLQYADLCAGFAPGGTILEEAGRTGQVPVVTGPVAPVLERDDDPLAWHDVAPLPAHGMRRRRRLDVWDGGPHAVVECFFRDSHVDADDVETVVHEYTVHATVDTTTMRFLSCEADVGALPWVECPAAAASAQRLAGAPADGLRGWVRDTFVGRSTCTHLNDTLRSLEDVPALLRALEGSR